MAAGTVERIQVVLQAVTKGFAAGLGRAQKQLKTVGKNVQEFGQVMQMPLNNFKEINKNMQANQSIGGRVAKRFRMMTHGMRGFRMEALGVMFFGMMMQKMFMGLLQPVMEAFGVFDLFRLMLLTLFLPVMELIFPMLLGVMDWFMNLPDRVKKTIGILVILGAVFGTILMVLGQFALGIGSLIMFFGALASPILIVVAALTALAGFLLLKNFFKDLGKNSDEAREKLVSFGISGEVFDTMKEKIISWWGILKEKFSGLKSNLSEWIGNILPIALAGGGDLLMKIVEGIVKNSKKIGNALQILIGKIITWVSENSESIVQGGLDILNSILDGLINNVDKVSEFLEAMVVAIGTWIGNNADKLAGLGLKIMGAIVKGIVGGALNIGTGIANKITGALGVEGQTTFNANTQKFERKDDFIWRPGQAPISINPNDSLIGFKGAAPNLGGGANIVQENHFNGFTLEDLGRALDDRDRKLVDEIRRQTK